MSPGFGFNWIRAARRWVFESLPSELHGSIFALEAFGDLGIEGDAVLADDF
jgi:hypothetical protein